MNQIGRLHVLTDTELQSHFSHLELTKMAIKGGADTIQFRQKNGSTRDLIETARKMKSLCEETGVTFIVNDRIDVAIAAEAHGVHLGQNDFPIPLARKMKGGKFIIGGSASTLSEALECQEQGCDYIGWGPVFPTDSKADAGPVSGLTLLRQVSAEMKVPVIAIGGINVENIKHVIEAGAYGIAVISAVCCQKKPDVATRQLHQVIYRREQG